MDQSLQSSRALLMNSAREWLSPNLHLEASELVPSPLDGTGQWLQDDARFQEWMNQQHGSTSKLLWLHGPMKTGKTTLVKFIIQQLVKRCRDAYDDRPVYFYCERQTGGQKLLPILLCLLRQLAAVRGGEVSHEDLESWYLVRRERENISPEHVTEMIIGVLNARQSTHVLIDAFNECDKETQTQLLHFIRVVTQEVRTTIRFLVTSRRDLLKKQVHDSSVATGLGVNLSDIKLYVEHSLSKLPMLPSELHAKLSDHLINGAQGMFTWIDVQLGPLRCPKANYSTRVESFLEDPKDRSSSYFGDLYWQGMKRQRNETEQQISRIIFRWMLSCRHDLDSNAFRDMISCQAAAFEDSTYDPDYRIDTQEILDATFDLVSHDKKADVFHFVHPSVREFFHQSAKNNNSGQTKKLEEWRNHAEIASTCIALMNAFHTLSLPDCNAIRYAKLYWAEHLRLYHNLRGPSRLTHDSVTDTSATTFVQEQNPVFRSWCADMDDFYEASGGYQFPSWWETKLRDGRHAFLNVSHALLLACEWGFIEIVKSTLCRMEPATLNDLRTIKGSNLLHLAIASKKGQGLCEEAWTANNLAMLELLLDKGVDVNAEDRYGVTPLHVAVAHSNLDAVRLLLQYGAWDDSAVLSGGAGDAAAGARTPHIPTPLHDAVRLGNSEIVQMLLQDREKKIVDSFDEHRQTPLLQACQAGNEEMVRLLCDASADVDIADDAGDTALIKAVEVESTSIVRVLLQRFMDLQCTEYVDRSNTKGDRALHLAALRGNFEVVQELLTYGAEVNVPNNSGESALRIANDRGYGEIVEVLTDYGAADH